MYFVLFELMVWFSFYCAGVHSKCFNGRLCPRCLHREISTLFLNFSHVVHSSPKSWNEGMLCNESCPFSLSEMLCPVNASVAICSRCVYTETARFTISPSRLSCSGSKLRNECSEKLEHHCSRTCA